MMFDYMEHTKTTSEIDENGNMVGSIVELHYNPTEKSEELCMDKNGRLFYSQAPDFIVIGHELIHAYRKMYNIYNRGTLGRYLVPDINVDINNTLYGREQRTEELETIGLSYVIQRTEYVYDSNNHVAEIKQRIILHSPTVDKYTENSLRMENTLPIRVAYEGRGVNAKN